MDTGQSSSERARLEAAFQAHHRRVFAYSLRRTSNAADAEDATSETFAVAWRRVADLPSAEEALPWLLGVARRVLANQRRGSARRVRLLDRLRRHAPTDAAPPSESPAIEALARLRPDDRELLRLLAWDGLSQAEASRVLGISANAVAIRLHRARKRFAEELRAVEGASGLKGSADSRTSEVVEGGNARSDSRRVG